jgi:hypothetical protein
MFMLLFRETHPDFSVDRYPDYKLVHVLFLFGMVKLAK